MDKFYSDRVTEIFMSPSSDDMITAHEVTLSDTRREVDSVNFETFAWCPDQESANRIACALNVSVGLSAAEVLATLSAMETAADSYESEANRTNLSDIRRILTSRAKRTRAIASNIKNRALEDSSFARDYRDAVS